MSGANLRTPGTDNPGGRDRSRKHCSRETGTAGTEGKKPAPQVSQTRDRIRRHRRQETGTASITDEKGSVNAGPNPQAPQIPAFRPHFARPHLPKPLSAQPAFWIGRGRSRTGLNGKPERGKHQPWENITRSPLVHSPTIGVYASPRTARRSPEDNESFPAPDNEQRRSARSQTDQTQDTETL